MKILVVSNMYPPDFLGGYELGCAQMVDALRGRGHDVRVITASSARVSTAPYPGVMRRLAVPPIYSIAQMEAVGHDVLAFLHAQARAVNTHNLGALATALEEFEPDVAYLWNLLGAGGLGILGLLDHQGVPWVWHLQDRVPQELCSYAGFRSQLAGVFGEIFHGAYIGCSSHLIGEVRSFGFDLGEQVTVIPNWVVGQRPPRREVTDHGGELRILSASGSLAEEKGAHILIEAAGTLRSSGMANFRIDMYGHEHDPRWRKLIIERDLAGIVRLMGPRSHAEMLGLYNDYDVFAFPTWTREPFGFVALEAAAAGCLPVVTADSGIAEWLIDEVDCLTARREPGAVAQRLAQILRAEVDVAGIVRRGQESVWRYFHIDNAASQVQDVLEDACSRARPARGSLAEFFTLARFAEGLAQTLVLEAA